MRVRIESRSRVCIVWYDNEEEATQRAQGLITEFGQAAINDANIGIVQCGRAEDMDREVNGQMAYAVVMP